MAKLDHDTGIKLATSTLDAIEAAVLANSDNGHRAHLGASQIGKPCARALWYGFRWATAPKFPPRILRLFQRGHKEEDNINSLLRAAGITVHSVDPATGRQFNFGNGHFAGSMDAALVGLPEAPKAWHVGEWKTHSFKSFNSLAAKGVKTAKPEHWAQMQCYMAWTGMQRAFYLAVCKDDDRLHAERIDFDKDAAAALFAKADAIINASEPPQRLSEDPSWFECKFCEHAPTCHGTQAPDVSCRTCTHSTPAPGGAWSCARHKRPISTAKQRQGCDAHRYIPAVLHWLKPVDACETDNWVEYETKTGQRVKNGGTGGLQSHEIHAGETEAQALIDSIPGMRQIVNDFGAVVVK